MDKDEFKKCKSDPVYFIEKYLGLELLEWQKIYLRLYKKNIPVFYGARSGKEMLLKVIKKYESKIK